MKMLKMDKAVQTVKNYRGIHLTKDNKCERSKHWYPISRDVSRIYQPTSLNESDRDDDDSTKEMHFGYWMKNDTCGHKLISFLAYQQWREYRERYYSLTHNYFDSVIRSHWLWFHSKTKMIKWIYSCDLNSRLMKKLNGSYTCILILIILILRFLSSKI